MVYTTPHNLKLTNLHFFVSSIQFLQGVLMLQDQYRATIQYSRISSDSSRDKQLPSDWFCGKCGVFNFKRRDNCFKCYASREESEKGGEGSDEISNILTKSKTFLSCNIFI